MASMGIRVGLCGFTMSMAAYSRYFPVVEVQNTFYDPPRDGVMKKWLATTAPSLEYTIKVWQKVTHAANSPTYRRITRPLLVGEEPGYFRDSPAVEQGWQRSVECADLLSATGMLFQCPASFRPEPENVQRMCAFFGRIQRPKARLLWEPRGAEWVVQRELALSLCRDLDLVHVVDPFVTKPAPHCAVYWRLHGLNGAHNSYSEIELNWLHRLLLDTEPRGTPYVLFNNLPRVADAKRFCQILKGAA